MIDDDLRSRAKRLIAGEVRPDDLDRLYLGQRTRAGCAAAFREIGDFIAHRDCRDKGLITQAARDVFTSFDVWSLGLRGKKATWPDIVRAAKANLRIATDAQIKAGCGCSRQLAKSRLTQAIAKFERKAPLTQAEEKVLIFLGNNLIWRPAFDGFKLVREFGDSLVRNQILDRSELVQFGLQSTPIMLHALATMHGSTVTLEGGVPARLMAGYANTERRLEVKVEITFSDMAKPIWAPVCLFLTDLRPEENCEPVLVHAEDPMLMDHWPMPLELNRKRRLAPV
jgi:hypothetical protein